VGPPPERRATTSRQPSGQVARVLSGSVQTEWNSGPCGDVPNGTVPIGPGPWKYCSSPPEAWEAHPGRMVVFDPVDRRYGTVDGRRACRLAGEREVHRGRKHQLRQDG
jgi:hypothetical protein